jgi:hypothetical protein
MEIKKLLFYKVLLLILLLEYELAMQALFDMYEE